MARAKRALAEFRIRGVSTNIPFLQAVLEDPDFARGDVSTQFIEERPQLFGGHVSKDRGTKVLGWLADVTVNKPNGERRPQTVEPSEKLPAVDLSVAPPEGQRDLLRRVGPAAWARALREQTALAVTETTMRDAHQSLLATRVRTKDLVAVAPHVARLTPQLLSVEAWGGATYDVALRFLGEDPWERLASLRAAIPNIPVQMLLRGRNTVGYTPYPTEVTDAFVAEAAASGVDVFRCSTRSTTSRSCVPPWRPCSPPTRPSPKRRSATPATSSTPPRTSTRSTTTSASRSRWSRPARTSSASRTWPACSAPAPPSGSSRHCASGSTSPCTCTPTTPRAASWRPSSPRPAPAPTPSTSPPRRWPAPRASRACPRSSRRWRTTERDTGLDLAAVGALEPYWEAVRRAYAPFESGLPGPTGRVYQHEIPGGQLSNLRQQAIALGLGDRFEQVEDWYAAANRILGRPTKVTPSSKVVGDLALQLAAVGADPEDFEQNPQKYDIPDSVVGFMAGELGDLPGGWPEPFRSKVLAGREVRLTVTPVPDEERAHLAASGPERQQALNRLLFPQPTRSSSRSASSTGTSPSCRPRTTCTGCVPVRSTSCRSVAASTCSSGSRRSARSTSGACARS